jgi:2-succinyl-5-enolpyruvyl-6-hydroxy-3-cyclohexene-1-carboxylate synthase
MLGEIPTQHSSYFQSWQNLESRVSEALPKLLQQGEFGEYGALATVLDRTPCSSLIHVANSMAVRYLNFLGRRTQEICCNRGTSGIDGSSSTAVGAAFVRKGLVTLITGDMAFFYDRNAFWHNYPLSNLRIILLNNHAGGIFRLIEGPAKQPELAEFFETQQALTAAHLAAEYGFGYDLVRNAQDLDQALATFFEESAAPKILEIESESAQNEAILKSVKEQIFVVNS